MVVRQDGGGNGKTFPEMDETHLSGEGGFGKNVRIDARRKDFDCGVNMSAWDLDWDK
jgi:hypothetical protein